MASITQTEAAPSAAAGSDALKSVGSMWTGVHAVWSGAKVCGPAYTVQCYPQSIITVHKGLLEAPRDHVLVVDAGGDATGALFGGLMARDAQQAGIAGLVTDGAVRDVDDLQELGFPAFALATTPRVGTNRRIGNTGCPVSCGGCLVRPGDYIIADADGVLVIASERVDEILGSIRKIQSEEEVKKQAMANGERLADILGFRGMFDPAVSAG